LRKQLALVKIDTFVGQLRFDETTGHFSKNVYIGRANDDGQFDVVEFWNEGRPVPLDPFPFPKLKEVFAKDGLG